MAKFYRENTVELCERHQIPILEHYECPLSWMGCRLQSDPTLRVEINDLGWFSVWGENHSNFSMAHDLDTGMIRIRMITRVKPAPAECHMVELPAAFFFALLNMPDKWADFMKANAMVPWMKA